MSTQHTAILSFIVNRTTVTTQLAIQLADQRAYPTIYLKNWAIYWPETNIFCSMIWNPALVWEPSVLKEIVKLRGWVSVIFCMVIPVSFPQYLNIWAKSVWHHDRKIHGSHYLKGEKYAQSEHWWILSWMQYSGLKWQQ